MQTNGRLLQTLGVVAAGVVGAGALYWAYQSLGKADAPAASAVDQTLQEADAEQVRMMEERIIEVDEQDRPVAPGTKKACHRATPETPAKLHRAFSVFLFNHRGQLLLQRRAGSKITFPLYWANTCCSHPLHTDGEMDEANAMGVKRAAVRKLEQELGITADQVPLDSFVMMTKLQYNAVSQDPGNAAPGVDGARWAEHEIDHILLCLPPKDVEVNPNANEVCETCYMEPEEVAAWVEEREAAGEIVSPWFRVIAEGLGGAWWPVVRQLRASGDELTAERLEAAFGPLARRSHIFRAGDVDADGRTAKTIIGRLQGEAAAQ